MLRDLVNAVIVVASVAVVVFVIVAILFGVP